MPISDAEIKRVLDDNEASGLGLPAARFRNVRQRYTVAKTRRLLMRYDDLVLLRLNDIWRDAWRDMRGIVAAIPDSIDTSTREYTRAVITVLSPRFQQLGEDTALFMYQRLSVAYAIGMVLGTWQLRESFDDDAFIPPAINWRDIGQTILDQERDEADQLVFDLLGEDWREQYGEQVDEIVAKLRVNMNAALGTRKGVREVMKSIRDTMGIDISKRTAKGNFFKTTVIARSHTIYTYTNSALESYRQYPDVINQIEWIATNDSRTCAQCSGLDGKRWKLDSPQMKRPVSDTHPNCRCDLIPTYSEEPAEGKPTNSAKSYFADSGNANLFEQLQPKNWE